MGFQQPLQATKDGILFRLGVIYKSLTEDELVEKSGLPEYVPEAIQELIKSGEIESFDGGYQKKGRK